MVAMETADISVIIIGPAAMSVLDYIIYFAFFISVFIIIFSAGFLAADILGDKNGKTKKQT